MYFESFDFGDHRKICHVEYRRENHATNAVRSDFIQVMKG